MQGRRLGLLRSLKLEKWRMLHRGGGPWKWRQRKALPAVLICSTDETFSRLPWTVCKHYRVLRRAFGARCGQRDREARVLGRVHEYFYMLSDRNTDRNRAPASPMPILTRIAPSPQGTTFRLACSRLLVSTSTLLSLRILVTTTIAGFWNVSSCFRHNAVWILTLRIVSLSVPLSSLNRAATTRRCALRARLISKDRAPAAAVTRTSLELEQFSECSCYSFWYFVLFSHAPAKLSRICSLLLHA